MTRDCPKQGTLGRLLVLVTSKHAIPQFHVDLELHNVTYALSRQAP